MRKSYYEKEKIPVNLGKIRGGDYLIILDNKVIGLLRIGNSKEFSGNYGIGFIGILQRYRRKGISKKVISFCEKQAKKRGINEINLAVPSGSVETQTIFKKLGFKNKEILTTVVFEDCYFMSLSEVQLKYLDMSKRTGLLGWQIMSIKIT